MNFIFRKKLFYIFKNIVFFWRRKLMGTLNIFIHRVYSFGAFYRFIYIFCVG